MSNSIWDESRLRSATTAAGVGLWSWNIETDEIRLDERSCNLWGLPNMDSITFEILSSRIHPADLDRVRSAFRETRGLVGLYEIDFRILIEDQISWISARGQGEDDEIIYPTIFGVFLDVSMRKKAEIAKDLISKEMDHRINNLFAVTSALARISFKTTDTKEEMAVDLSERLQSLATAHALVRSDPNQQYVSTSLKELFTVLLSPYIEKNSSVKNLLVSSPDIDVCQDAATTLALITHELATNSVKFGALSVEGGSLTVRCIDNDGDVIIHWKERGGPPVVAPVGSRGFGSRLVTESVYGQLGGDLSIEWQAKGIFVKIRVKKEHLEH
ncbi:sensor histidine kinase [Planktotalea arctica]|uniref:sensor histidine kinase n=1 Tax=Planktotalea arctica TaxID=1481893 RepID=UPI003219AB76